MFYIVLIALTAIQQLHLLPAYAQGPITHLTLLLLLIGATISLLETVHFTSRPQSIYFPPTPLIPLYAQSGVLLTLCLAIAILYPVQYSALAEALSKVFSSSATTPLRLAH